MKFLPKCFLIGLISIATKTAFAQHTPVVISFYNMENFYDTINDPTINDEDFLPTGAYNYTSEVYHNKLRNLEEVLSQIGTDHNPDGFAFLGTAEIENQSVLEDLVAMPKLKNRNLKIVEFPSPDARGIDVAFLYNPKYFKLLAAQALPTPLKMEDGTDDKYKTRDVLWVTGKLNGEKIHVFVNHWPSRRGGEAATAPKRKIAAGVSRHIIDSLAISEPNVKVVVMGDLNDDPINESITKVLNAKQKIKDVHSAKEMYNPFIDFYKKGLGSMAYNDAWSLFDQIMLSYGLVNSQTSGLHYNNAEIFNRPFLVEKFGQYKGYPKRSFSGNIWNNGYSDHFPSIIYLK